MGATDQNSPTGSSTFLPLAKQLRRASVSSITSLFDKHALTQTLDQIHTSASQSDSLTTFNDYAPPPPASAESKNQARPSSPVGIGAWYSRVRGSVAPKAAQPDSKQRPAPIRPVALETSSGPRTHTSKPSTASGDTESIAVKSPPKSPELNRSSSRLSNHSKSTEPSVRKANGDKVIIHNSTLPPTQSTSHKHVLSSSSHNSVNSVQELRKDMRSGRDMLKKSMTPDPSAPSSPMLSGEDRMPRKAASVALDQVPSRSTSVSSSIGRRLRLDEGPSNGKPIQKDFLSTESIPKLSRFDSLTDGQARSPSPDSSTFTQITEEGQSRGPLSQATQRNIPAKDAVASLRRLQSQGSGRTNTQNSSATASVGSTLAQLRNRVLSRQYWMKDENARDCFYCGDSFSTFRRKHHCRTCGQIFDAKCTTLVSGASFGQSGTIRVCKPCEGIINGYDDSSDYTDDDTSSIMTSGFRRRHNSKDNGDMSPSRPSTPQTPGFRHYEQQYHSSRTNLNNFKTYFPNPIGRRIIDDLKRTSGHFEDESDRRSIRPMSSRSLKSSHGPRTHLPGHRRHHSKHLLLRGTRMLDEERAPFYQIPDKKQSSGDKLPAFHSDNVIDPDLAAYLSDDADTDDDEQSIAAALNGSKTDPSSSVQFALPPTPLLRRPTSRYGDRLVASRNSEVDFDAASVGSSKLRRRNVSFTSSALLNSPPKPQRLSVAAHQWSSPSVDGITGGGDSPYEAGLMIRSTSLQGIRAPAVELNNASLQHGRRLLRQMLEEDSVPDVDAWEKALMPIMLRATDDVVPNVPDGDAINITNYVKLKKAAGGSPGDSGYVSGVVFSKNLALKSMPRRIAKPTILILTFAIEYSRHEQHFMSLEPVIRQEREYLSNLVNRIAALKPQLVFVQRNVAGIALELLNEANIAVAHNVKRSVLEAISRCCQTRIITSMDKLEKLPGTQSKCEAFSLRTFPHNGRRKTYMYLSGCPKELGCTIVLRGASTTVLHQIKRISEFMLQAIYNLRLETSFMRDEFVLIPHYGAEGTIRHTTALTTPGTSTIIGSLKSSQESAGVHTRVSSVDQSDKNTEAGLCRNDGLNEAQEAKNGQDDTDLSVKGSQGIPDDVPAPTFYSDLVDNQRTRIISTSPFVKFMQPYLLMRARESETRLNHLKKLLNQDAEDLAKSGEADPDKFALISPDTINETVKGTSRGVREILQAVHESEYDKATHIYRTQAKQWESSVAGNADMFNPLSHQSITVLHALICVPNNITCSGPDLISMRFYDDHGEEGTGVEADCTLGQYVEDSCWSANTVCGMDGCDKKLSEHKRHYVHGEGMIEVSVERCAPRAPGLDNVILMWSVCRLCGKETQTIPMSSNTFNYSFGKYLELGFWSIDLRPRADVCPHDVHRDYTRYFGFEYWAVKVQYDPINLLEVIVPRTRITWKVVNDLKFKNDNYKKAERRLNKFTASVRERLKSIRFDTIVEEKAEECKQEVERLTALINEDHQAVLQKLQEKYVSSKFYEIIPFNRALRMLHEKASEWDEIFQDVEMNYFPSEKDIRRLATLQLKKIFLDREDGSAPLTSSDGTANTSFTEDMTSGDGSPDTELNSASSSRLLSPEKAHEMMASVIEDDAKGVQSNLEDEVSNSLTLAEPGKADDPPLDPSDPSVDHLDLAVASSTSPKQPSSPKTSQVLEVPANATPKALSPIDTKLAAESKNQSLDGASASSAKRMEATGAAPKKPKASGIPRIADIARRLSNLDSPISPPRSQSQPGSSRQILRALTSRTNSPQRSPIKPFFDTSGNQGPAEGTFQRRGSQKFSFASVRDRSQSFIPRSIAATKRSTRVSALTKHFEQLSKEFEKQRIKDQQRRALKHRQAGAYPAAALKPIVEIYRDVSEAINESDVDLQSSSPEERRTVPRAEHKPVNTAKGEAQNLVDKTDGDGFHAEGARAKHPEEAEAGNESKEAEGESRPQSKDASEILSTQGTVETVEDDVEESQEKLEDSVAGDEHDADLGEDYDYEVELPKHEKSSLMKMLTNFWAERSSSGWESLYYPLRDVDHIFANTDIVVREDEPSSLIALALDHDDYHAHMANIAKNSAATSTLSEKAYVDDTFLTAEEQRDIEKSLLQETGHHLNYLFERSSAKMQCKIFWAEQFAAVRKKCGVSERVVESLSRCLKWDSKGGKTKSVFLKTLDDRFVLKSLSQVETRSFLRFAPYYFNLMGQALFHELPSLIAKLLGFYQVTIKNPVTGTDFDWYLLLMENLFYDRTPQHIFDLKGSMRNRRITPSGERDEVLLDENMVEFIAEHPIFAREHSKKLLRSSIYNDTLFLARRNVMDYSLMLGIDERDGRTELVVGIIDCIRTYTWDKKLETWVKDRGKNRPTVTEPKDYKNRFREAINRYVMEAPTCWQFPGQQLLQSQQQLQQQQSVAAVRAGLPRTETSLTEREDEAAVAAMGESLAADEGI